MRCEIRRCGTRGVPQRLFLQRRGIVACHSAVIRNAPEGGPGACRLHRARSGALLHVAALDGGDGVLGEELQRAGLVAVRAGLPGCTALGEHSIDLLRGLLDAGDAHDLEGALGDVFATIRRNYGTART